MESKKIVAFSLAKKLLEKISFGWRYNFLPAFFREFPIEIMAFWYEVMYLFTF